jgi:hypothetical protein
MLRRLLLVCVGVVALTTAASAQDADPAVTASQLRQALTERDAALKEELKTIVAEALAGQERAKNSEGLVPIKPAGDHEERITRLEGDYSRLAKEIGNHNATLGQIAMQGEDGTYHPRFDTNSAKGALNQALRSNVPDTGELIVRNKTSTCLKYVVNGYEYTIPRNGEKSISVKPGTVVTRLAGQQERLTWFVGMPNYKQFVELVVRTPPPIWVGY